MIRSNKHKTEETTGKQLM